MKYGETELLDIWERICNKNRFMQDAIDPPFCRARLEKCERIQDYINF
jgi:hypothetical protein